MPGAGAARKSGGFPRLRNTNYSTGNLVYRNYGKHLYSTGLPVQCMYSIDF
jgi:hypothetical protein